MKTHSQEFLAKTETEAGTTLGNQRMYTQGTENFQARLEDMKIELNSEVRKCDGLLGGMSLATQMVRSIRQLFAVSTGRRMSYLLTFFMQEWNFHTRRDARENIIIAYASKRDSSQMKYISFLGMVFLLGTFLAVSSVHD